MAAYAPANPAIFYAAMAGAIAGMTTGGLPVDPVASDAVPIAHVASAYAQSVDQQWTVGSVDSFQVAAMQLLSSGVWAARTPNPVDPFFTPATFNATALAVIALTVGAGQFIAANVTIPPSTVANTAALTKVAWYIDEVAGNDSNGGNTPSTALKTCLELARRWGKGGILQPATGTNVDVFYLSNATATNPIIWDITCGIGVSLNLHGPRTVVRTGSITAFTTVDSSTQTRYQIQDVAVVSWAADITADRIITITSGANAGTSFFIDTDLGGGSAIINTPTKSLSAVRGSITVGDTYSVSTLGTVFFGSIDVTGINAQQLTSTFQIDGLSIGNGSAVQIVQWRTHGIRTNQFECVNTSILSPLSFPDYLSTVAGCKCKRGINTIGKWTYSSCLVKGISWLFQPGSYGIATNDMYLSGVGVQMVPASRLDVSSGLAVFNSAIGVQAFPGGGIFNQGGRIWGTGNTVGFKFNAGAVLINQAGSNTPNITGVTEIQLPGGATTDFVFDPAVGAYVSPAITVNWASVIAATPGGFGGRIVSPTGGYVIAPL